MKNTSFDWRKSALGFSRNPSDSLDFPATSRGHGARTATRTHARSEFEPESSDDDHISLGEPLNIRQVASMIGCSVWSVRQRHVRHGLPHFRSSPSGKLIFYRDQVVAWILENQIRERVR